METEATPPAEEVRRRGRPRDYDPQRVLDAALDVFWRQGYRPTTTRELEQATGLSQSSIYNAFGSKWGLLDAALGHYETATSRHLLEPLEASADGLAAIDRFFVDLAAWVTSDGRRGCLLINMMAEDGGATADVTRRVRAYRDRVRAAFRAALARESGGVGAAETLDERADLLVGLVMGLDVAARGGAGRAELGGLLAAIRGQIRGWAAA